MNVKNQIERIFIKAKKTKSGPAIKDGSKSIAQLAVDQFMYLKS